MKKNLLTFLIGINFLLLLLSPVTVLGQTTNTTAQQTECAKLQDQINKAGGGRASTLPQYCDTNAVYSKIVGFAYYIIGIAAVISIIYGGYVYMMAGSNEANKKKAKTILMYTIAGVVLALLATTIVAAVINLVVDNKLA